MIPLVSHLVWPKAPDKRHIPVEGCPQGHLFSQGKLSFLQTKGSLVPKQVLPGISCLSSHQKEARESQGGGKKGSRTVTVPWRPGRFAEQ